MLDFGFYNLDCMEGMKEFPDNYFELAIVDPPYGLGSKLLDGGCRGGMGSLRTSFGSMRQKDWDVKPDKFYFDELLRCSKEQIIWGGNYFLDHLNSTTCMIVWDKMNGTNPLVDAELAWTSFDKTTRIFRMHHFSKGYDNKIHPTQKPVALYRWLLQNYAKQGDKILDTHAGSFSQEIACEIEGFDYVAFEIDKDYFRDGTKRLKQTRITTIDMFKEPKKQILENEEIVF